MSREERAKQFMPFSALKGYDEALRRMEAKMEGAYAEKEWDSAGINDNDNKVSED